MSKDPFASVPEFLAAFNNILENGFFEEIQFNSGGKMMEGIVYGCSITITGCVPSDKKYKADGCGAIIDPNAVVASCRRLTGENQVKNIVTKVETNDWPLYDTKEENIIGSKGARTQMYMYINFKT